MATTAGNYVITGGAGLTVTAAARQADNVTVILTTSAQTASQSYTVTASTVTDRNGNVVGHPGSAGFTGFLEAGNLTVTQATPAPRRSRSPRGRTTTSSCGSGWAAAAGSVTVNTLKVQETGTAVDATDITTVRFYDDGNQNRELAAGLDDAEEDFASRRHVVEMLNVYAKLVVENEEKVAYVTCVFKIKPDRLLILPPHKNCLVPTPARYLGSTTCLTN